MPLLWLPRCARCPLARTQRGAAACLPRVVEELDLRCDQPTKTSTPRTRTSGTSRADSRHLHGEKLGRQRSGF
jgi:hypothetical protein